MAAKTSRRNPLTPFYVILGVVAVGGVLLLLNQLRGGGGGGAAMSPVAVPIDPSELARVQGVAVGREDAPVVIYEFADFQCPSCAQFATFMAPLIKERLVDTGVVRYVYYDFPLSQHPHAFLASRAARCANEQGRFWEYHDYLYARQATWSAMGSALDYFLELGEQAGIPDQNAFEQCVRSERYQEEVSRSLALGQSLGVDGTPSLFVNGKRAQIPGSFAEFEALVRAEAGTATPGTAAPDTTAA